MIGGEDATMTDLLLLRFIETLHSRSDFILFLSLSNTIQYIYLHNKDFILYFYDFIDVVNPLKIIKEFKFFLHHTKVFPGTFIY